MMRSLFSGVSGLKIHQTRMDSIGNNIANINTTGFKSSRTTFSDMLSQTQAGAGTPTANLGGTNPRQIGLGAAVASIDIIFGDGAPQATGKNTDVAISGSALFVVKNGDQTYYTRDGAFEFDAEGNYVLPGTGLYVQGWTAVNGSLNTNAEPENIVVPAGKTMNAAATNRITYSGNLDSGDPLISTISYTDSDGNTVTLDPSKSFDELSAATFFTDSDVINGTYWRQYTDTAVQNLDGVLTDDIWSSFRLDSLDQMSRDQVSKKISDFIVAVNEPLKDRYTADGVAITASNLSLISSRKLTTDYSAASSKNADVVAAMQDRVEDLNNVFENLKVWYVPVSEPTNTNLTDSYVYNFGSAQSMTMVGLLTDVSTGASSDDISTTTMLNETNVKLYQLAGLIDPNEDGTFSAFNNDIRVSDTTNSSTLISTTLTEIRTKLTEHIGELNSWIATQCNTNNDTNTFVDSVSGEPITLYGFKNALAAYNTAHGTSYSITRWFETDGSDFGDKLAVFYEVLNSITAENGGNMRTDTTTTSNTEYHIPDAILPRSKDNFLELDYTSNQPPYTHTIEYMTLADAFAQELGSDIVDVIRTYNFMKAYAYARTSNNPTPESSETPASPVANRDYDEANGPRMSDSTAFYATMMYEGTSGTNLSTTNYNIFRSAIDRTDEDNLGNYDDYFTQARDLYNHLQSTAYNSQFATDGSDMFIIDSDDYDNLLQLIAGWDQDNDPNHTSTNEPMSSFLSNYEVAARLVDYLHALQVGDATSKTTVIVTKDDVDLLDYDTDTDTGVHVSATSAYLTLSDGTRQSVTTGTYTVSRSVPITTVITVFDSEGGSHKVPILLTKTGANTWQASLSGAIRERTSSEDNETLLYKVVSEDDGSTTTIRMNPTTFTFDTDGTYLTGSADISFEFTNGAADLTATVDFSSLTQFDGNNTAYPSADGNKAGVLTSVAIDSNGVITGTYTNGLRQNEAQIAVAQFVNPGGLTKTGNTFWQESNNSGSPNVKTAPDLGISITPSALEMSNVDLANEFSEMIITQRGFQANSKIINVGDEMLETLVNMKR